MSTVTDPIADLAGPSAQWSARAEDRRCLCPYSQIKAEVVRILKEEGYITDYEVDTEAAHPRIKITNKLVNRTERHHRSEASQPAGLRRYVGADEIPRVLGGMGISILSTSARHSVRP